MDIELQNLIEQDIDLGIKQSVYFDFERAGNPDNSPFEKKGEIVSFKENGLTKGRLFLSDHPEEDRKVKPILFIITSGNILTKINKTFAFLIHQSTGIY